MRGAGGNPHDTATSATARFLIELTAWSAGPWAVQQRTGSWIAAIATLLALFALPAVFNVPGDKNIDGVAVSGPVRIAIELLLLAVAVVGSWIAWHPVAAVAVAAIGVAMLASGRSRYRAFLATDPTRD